MPLNFLYMVFLQNSFHPPIRIVFPIIKKINPALIKDKQLDGIFEEHPGSYLLINSPGCSQFLRT